MLYRTLVVERAKSVSVTVFDKNYQEIKSYEESWKDKFDTTAGSIFNIIFPFSLNLSDYNTSYLNTNLKISDSIYCLIINIVFLLVYFFLFGKRDLRSKSFSNMVLILLSGIYGFVTVLLLKDNE